MKPTYEQLEQLLTRALARINELATQNASLASQNAELATQNAILVKKVAALEERLNRNSRNSSKSPSTDQKTNTTPPEKHPKKTRAGFSRSLYSPERVNSREKCTLDCCPHCGSSEIVEDGAPMVLQQAELPPVEATVTEYSLGIYGCASCGQRSVASLPLGIPHSAFGPKVQAVITTLTGVFHMARREAMQLLRDLFKINVSVGSVINIEATATRALTAVHARIQQAVMRSHFPKHFDETSWRDSGQRHYVWLASTEQAAFFKIDPSRSAEAFKLVIGEHGPFAAVTDRYAVYSSLPGPHQHCLAHLIRDFHGYAERKGVDGPLGHKIECALRRACWSHARYRQGKISRSKRDRRIERWRALVRDGLEDGHANGSKDLSGLCSRILNGFDKLWTFMQVEGMEPTNNLAERDLRKIVLWRKKSHGTRSGGGQRFVECITSVTETAKRVGQNILGFIESVIRAYWRHEPAPFMSPAHGF